jgi:hypothetical protein
VPKERTGRLLLPQQQLLVSCEKKKQLLWAEWLRDEVVAEVARRHVVLTIPPLLRPLFPASPRAVKDPGFSAEVGETIPFEDKKAIEDVACYIVRNPLSLKKLVYPDGHKAVLYRSRMNPSLGRNFEAMDPLEWLARLADHIPDPGEHRTHFYAHYANRVRGQRPSEGQGRQKHEEERPKKRRCSPTYRSQPTGEATS